MWRMDGKEGRRGRGQIMREINFHEGQKSLRMLRARRVPLMRLHGKFRYFLLQATLMARPRQGSAKAEP